VAAALLKASMRRYSALVDVDCAENGGADELTVSAQYSKLHAADDEWVKVAEAYGDAVAAQDDQP